jgi:hypothetical protein
MGEVMHNFGELSQNIAVGRLAVLHLSTNLLERLAGVTARCAFKKVSRQSVCAVPVRPCSELGTAGRYVFLQVCRDTLL